MSQLQYLDLHDGPSEQAEGTTHRNAPANRARTDPARVAAIAELDRLSAHLTDAAQQLRRFMAIATEEPAAVGDAAHSLHRAQVALSEARSALASASGTAPAPCADRSPPGPRH